MLLKEVLRQEKEEKWKKDILEFLSIDIKNDYFWETYYKNKIESLPSWDYFISDLDWTFFRWVLSQETFSLFFKYIKNQNILKYDLNIFKEFIEDNMYFDILEKKAYNKEIKHFEYIKAWVFLLFKYKKLIKWEDFLVYLKDKFYTKQKVNPFRFSLSKMKDTLLSWNNFLFLSWAPCFIFEIYLELLKEYISSNIWEKYANNIYGIWSYINIDKDYTIWFWNAKQKHDFIEILRSKWCIKSVVWAMWDTQTDFGLSYSLDSGSFYFVNPETSVINNFYKLKKLWIDYHFITERKDLIFEYNLDNIKVIEI